MPDVAKIDQPPELWDRLWANVGQLAMITTVDGQGRVNAATFATVVRVVHEPLHISFTTSLHKDTWRNVKETGQFTVNLAKFDRTLLEKACILGLGFAPGVNELDKAKLTALPARKVKPPRIKECHRHFECEVLWTKEWVNRVMIVGNAVAASVDEDCVDARGFLDFDRVRPVQYCGAPYQRMDEKPPYRHLFVGAYETMAVETLYDGPEVAAHNDLVESEEHWR